MQSWAMFLLFAFEIADIIIMRPSASTNMSVAKIVEIVGNSDKGWEDAAQVAVMEAYENPAWDSWNRSSRPNSASRF